MFSDQDITKFKNAWHKIYNSKKILLVSHLSPDVDALSSLGALIEILKKLNKNYLAFADGKNDNYYFLPNEEEIIGDKSRLIRLTELYLNQGEKIKGEFLSFFDLIIIVDCGSIERTSLSENIYNLRSLMADTFIIELDHHVPVKSYADIEIKIPLASTTELLYHFVNVNDIEINKALANCLLAGILTDTANFLYPSVSSKTLEIASELMILGAQFPKLLNNTWRNKSFFEMKLWGMALDNLKINKKYSIAFSVLTHKELSDFKEKFSFWNNEIFGDIVGFLSNLSEANIVMFLREEELGKIKGSLRVGSVDTDIDVTKLASVFGGGGHKKASGFMIDGHLVKKGNSYFIE